MTTFRELVDDELVKHPLFGLGEIVLVDGPDWNVGERAFLIVQVTNQTSYDLRNVVLSVGESGVYHVTYEPFLSPDWDGNGAFIEQLRPGQSERVLCAFMRAYRKSEGPLALLVHYSVDLIPRGGSTGLGGSFTIR